MCKVWKDDYIQTGMNIVSILHFSSFFVYVLLIIYVINKGPDSLPNRLCAVLIATFALISFAYGLSNSAASSMEALVFINIGTVGWCVGPMAGLWFYLALTGNARIMRNKAFIVFSIVLPSEKGIEEITRCSGTQFDPFVVAFKSVLLHEV